jgi:hypothetical protein
MLGLLMGICAELGELFIEADHFPVRGKVPSARARPLPNNREQASFDILIA